MAANQDFGPFFGFTIATRASAMLIGTAIAAGMFAVALSEHSP